MEKDRNVYMLTPDGWQHLGTGKVVQSGGISLDAADIQGLKELHLQRENEKSQNAKRKSK